MNETDDSKATEEASPLIYTEILAQHREALEALYQSAGVGGTLGHKLAFWMRERPGTFISHNPTEEQTVAIHEISWLADCFPFDFRLL